MEFKEDDKIAQLEADIKYVKEHQEYLRQKIAEYHR